MTREDIEKEAYRRYAPAGMGFDGGEDERDAFIKGAEWMQNIMNPLIDKMVEFNENDCEEISNDISNYDMDWCERNCNNFCKECINKWLEAKQAMKGE